MINLVPRKDRCEKAKAKLKVTDMHACEETKNVDIFTGDKSKQEECRNMCLKSTMTRTLCLKSVSNVWFQ